MSWPRQWRVLAAVVALLAYGVLLDPLGEVITTFLVLGFLFRVVAQLGWVASVVATVGATTLSHLLFAVWLKVPFPPGPWAP